MNNDLKKILQKLENKGEKGGINITFDEKGISAVRGKDGYSPVKGVDYFTEKEIRQIIDIVKEMATPVKGKDYYTAAEIAQMIRGIESRIRIPKDGKDGADGKDGKDGVSPDARSVAIDAITILESFEGDARLTALALRDLDKALTKLAEDGFEFAFTEKQLTTIKDLLPKYPPINAGGSGATFLKSLRDVDLSGLTKNADGKYVLGGGGSGSSNFLDLTDTPSSYTGQTGKFVRVNAGEDGLEFATISGSGDVVGPASATDNAIVRYDGNTGKIIQNSVKTLSDSGAVETLTPTVNDASYTINVPSNADATYDINFGSNLTSAAANVRLFRTTNTSGDARFVVMSGDGTTNLNHSLSAKSNSYLARLAGNVKIGGTSTPAAKLHVTNEDDSASKQILRLEGDRATPAANDNIYQSFILSDSAGNQDEMARFVVTALDVTSGSEDSRIQFLLRQSGTLSDRFAIETTNIRPATGVTMSLGTTGQGFTNGFFTTGSKLDWGNGNATLTHSAGLLTSNVDIVVPDEAYDATTWNGSLEVPTKNAIRDKIESMSSGSGITRAVSVTSGNVTAGSSANTDYVYFVAGAHTVSLPAASGNTNRYTIKNTHSANITIDTVGSETIDGTASIEIAPEESVDIISDGTNFRII